MTSSTAASDIIAALGGNERSGMCRCPAHDDRNPSLQISERNGKTLWKCHAGCSQEAVFAALKARGLFGKNGSKMMDRNSNFKRAERAQRQDQAADESERFNNVVQIMRTAARLNKEPADYLASRGIYALPAIICCHPERPKD